jgi:hypothetical protein
MALLVQSDISVLCVPVINFTLPTARSLTRKNTSLSRKSTEAGMPTAILELATLRRLKSQAMTGVLQYPASHGQRSMWLASQANIEEGMWFYGFAPGHHDLSECYF